MWGISLRPTPSVRQPLFETSDSWDTLHCRGRRFLRSMLWKAMTPPPPPQSYTLYTMLVRQTDQTSRTAANPNTSIWRPALLWPRVHVERGRERRRREGKRGKTRQRERNTQIDIHQKFGTKSANFVGETFAIKPQHKSVFKQKPGSQKGTPPSIFQDHFSTPDPQVCRFYFLNLAQKEKSLLRKTRFPLLREWKSWKLQWEQFLSRPGSP